MYTYMYFNFFLFRLNIEAIKSYLTPLEREMLDFSMTKQRITKSSKWFLWLGSNKKHMLKMRFSFFSSLNQQWIKWRDSSKYQLAPKKRVFQWVALKSLQGSWNSIIWVSSQCKIYSSYYKTTWNSLIQLLDNIWS